MSDSSKSYKLWLSNFAELSEDERSTFTFRQSEQIDRQKASNFESLAVGLIDWENQYDMTTGDEIEFDPDDLVGSPKRVITPAECAELLAKRAERNN